MERISRRFPQLFVAVYTGALGEIANLRPFGFWLLNHASFENLPAGQSNSAGILFTIDPETKSAGVVFGYLLDPFLTDSDTFQCLSRAHAYWLEGRYADGIIKALVHIEIILCKRSRQARRNPEFFHQKILPPGVPSDQWRRIRANSEIPQAEPNPTSEKSEEGAK